MGKYKFITDRDIESQLRAEFKSSLTDDDPNVIALAERMAIGQMKSKMNDRYDISAIFIDLPADWSNVTTYTTGERVFHDDTFWLASDDSTNEEPSAASVYWTEDDPRDMLVSSYCRDIALWHVHARINPRMIPEIREDRYAEAMAWLDAIRDGSESPDLPLKEDGITEIRWGSNKKRDYYW